MSQDMCVTLPDLSTTEAEPKRSQGCNASSQGCTASRQGCNPLPKLPEQTDGDTRPGTMHTVAKWFGWQADGGKQKGAS